MSTDSTAGLLGHTSRTYEFTLNLDHATCSDKLDARYEAGRDDATATVSGSGWLHFDRAALSLLDALTSAVRDVESTGLSVTAVVDGDFVSLKESRGGPISSPT